MVRECPKQNKDWEYKPGYIQGVLIASTAALYIACCALLCVTECNVGTSMYGIMGWPGTAPLPAATSVCKYLEIRPSPDRSPPGPGVEKHSGQGTFSEQPDTVVPPTEADQPHDN
jgi:hypothetical protein